MARNKLRMGMRIIKRNDSDINTKRTKIQVLTQNEPKYKWIPY